MKSPSQTSPSVFSMPSTVSSLTDTISSISSRSSPSPSIISAPSTPKKQGAQVSFNLSGHYVSSGAGLLLRSPPTSEKRPPFGSPTKKIKEKRTTAVTIDDPFVAGGAEIIVQTKHSIKLRLPTLSPSQPSAPKRPSQLSTPNRAPVTEPLQASTEHSQAADPRATRASSNNSPIYYIPHPNEFAERAASFPHTTYVITKGEEVGLFAAWHDAAIRVQKIPTQKGRIQYIMQSFPTFQAAFDVYKHAYDTRTLEVIPIPGGPFDVPINQVFEDHPNSSGEWESESGQGDEGDYEGWVFADSDEEIEIRASREPIW